MKKKILNLTVFLKEKKNHLYYIDDTPDKFFVLSNRKSKENFALYMTNFTKTAESKWKLFVAHKKNELIEDFLCFKDFIILGTRRQGLPFLVQVDMKCKKEYIEFKDKAYAVNLSGNNNYNARSFSFIYSSLKSPPVIYSQNLYTKKRKKNLETKCYRSQ